MPPTQPDKESISAIGKGFQISQRIIANCLTLLIPVAIGAAIDSRLATSPIALVTGLFVGMVASGFHLVSLVKFLQRSSQNSEHGPSFKHSPPPAEESHDQPSEKEEDPWEERWKKKWGDEDEKTGN